MKLRTRSRSRALAGGVIFAFVMSGLAVVPLSSAAAAEVADCPWMDTSKTPTDRANLLLDASTQHQKYRWLVEQPANNPTQTTYSGGVVYPVQVACTPTVTYTDGPDGIRFLDGVTAFPAQIALASTWNRDLSYAKGAAQGAEGFDKGKNGVLGPGVGSGRTPLSGRTPEYLGEDSLLSGSLAADVTNGLQNGNADKPVLAVIKHYVGNEQENSRQTSSSNIGEQALHEVYELPYEVMNDAAAPAGVMCSYNQINGVYGCENPLLNTNLKAQLGFDGYVVSDFGAVHSTAPALMAGLDQELNRPKFFTPVLLDAALSAGTITQAAIDRAAFNVVRAYIATGLFDHAAPTTPVANASTAEHKAISQQIAEEGSVLLKNQRKALPLSVGAGQSVALIGPTVSTTATNGISAKTACSMAWNAGNTMNCEQIVSPEVAFTARAAEAGASVTVNNGSDLTAAASAAAAADVAVVFANVKMGEFNDITDLHLQNNGDALISAVAASAKKTIVVLETGSAVEMPWLNNVDAVVEAWYPGDQQGRALASLLWGDTNFSGKLPMTFPKSLRDTPTSTAAQYPGILAQGATIRQVDFSEGTQVGYKWYDEQKIDPLYEFGFGLSYTEFDYSGLSVTTARDSSSGAVVSTATFTVTNTGSVAGDEIPQLYLALPASAGDPGKRLVGWDRVSLQPGESTTVSIDVDSSAANHPFGIWNTESDEWTNVDGAYRFSAGSSSRDLPLASTKSLEFTAAAPVVTLAATPAAPNGDAGWYTSPVTFAISAEDDVDSNPLLEVNIDSAGWFTTDGSVTLSTDGTHSVSVRATDDSGNVSQVVTSSVKIDSVTPQVVASSDGDARTVTLTASDATSGVARIEYAIEGSATWTEYTGPIAAGRSAVTYEYRAVDNAGNVSATEAFDYAPSVSVPAVGLTVSPKTVTFGKPVTLTATVPADAIGEVEFRNGSKLLATAPVTNGKATAVVSTLASGSRTITATFSGDPVYSEATSLGVTVTVRKASVSSVAVTTKSFEKGTKPRLGVIVGKLDNGSYPVGRITVYVDGTARGSKTVTASSKGKVALTLTRKYSSSITVKVKFTATDTKNVSSRYSPATKIKAVK